MRRTGISVLVPRRSFSCCNHVRYVRFYGIREKARDWVDEIHHRWEARILVRNTSQLGDESSREHRARQLTPVAQFMVSSSILFAVLDNAGSQ